MKFLLLIFTLFFMPQPSLQAQKRISKKETLLLFEQFVHLLQAGKLDRFLFTEIEDDFSSTFTQLAQITNATNTLVTNASSPTIITNATLPITISSPGRYIVAENLSYAATGAGALITINSSDVTLDLLGFSVAQSGGIANVDGIVVNSGLRNVTIRNGQVKNCSGHGISVASGCSRITIADILADDCGTRAISLVGTTASPIQEGTIRNCSMLSSCTLTTADNVLTLSNCQDIDVQNCKLNLNGSTQISAALSLVQLTNAARCRLSNIVTFNNIGNTDVRCFSLKQSSMCSFNECISSNDIAWGASSNMYGILLERNSTSTSNKFVACTMSNLTGTIVDGFLSSTGCDDNTFIGCSADSNTANGTSGIVHGFRCVSNNRNQFIECRASHNTALNSTIPSPFHGAYGFKIDTTTGTYVRKCIANDNVASVRATGFFFGATDQCVAEENSACRNTTWGFDVNNLTFNDQAFIKNFALKNNIAGGSGSNQYSGFGSNAANDGFTASNFGFNTGGLAGVPGPISWINLGIG